VKSRGARFRNLAVLCLVNFLWAAQYPAYKIASDHMEVAALSFWTFVIASVLLMPFLLRGRVRNPVAADPLSRWRVVFQFILLAVAGLLPPSVLLAWGISRSTASNAAILALTIPVLMVMMSIPLLGERPTPLRIISLVLALAGTVLISRNDIAQGSLLGGVLAGNIVIFLAGAGSAFYNTFGKKLLERFREVEVLIWGYAAAAVFCAVLSALLDTRPFYRVAGYPGSAWLAVLALGALPWGIAMVMWMWVLKRLEVSQVSVSIYLLPIFGVLLSALTLRERLTWLHLAGGALVFLATYLTSEYEARRAPA